MSELLKSFVSVTQRQSGQRIVARLRENTYQAALKQEVEFIERGEGDVISRLSVDTSIVGERCALLPKRLLIEVYISPQCNSELERWPEVDCHGFSRM